MIVLRKYWPMANPVVFRRNHNIGAADAEADSAFLQTCFVDTGDVAAITNCENAQCIVVGRTGAGKTALLQQLKRRSHHFVELSPETLALSYIANSKAIAFFEEAGVHMEFFYKLLWQHILVVEFLRLKYDVRSDADQSDMFAKIRGLFGNDSTKSSAMEYVRDFGGKFWLETAERTKGITERLETDLKASAKIDLGKIGLGAEGARKLSQEEKTEVIAFGQNVIDSLQIERLQNAIRLLREDVFFDDTRHYYVLIDALDEDWVQERLRFKLIRALIEAVRSLRAVPNVKVIFTLREDLLYSVLVRTASPGFQREKYNSLYLRLRWSREQLIDLLDRRIGLLFRRQYSGGDVKLTDILPNNQIFQRNMTDYILDRTFLRPREAILFINECIAQADGANKITKQTILTAEGVYSRGRVDALLDEWGREYPRLLTYLIPLRRKDCPIKLSELSDPILEPMCLEILEGPSADPLYADACSYYIDHKMDRLTFIRSWLRILYQLGVIGVKADTFLPRMWSFEHEPNLPATPLHDGSTIDVHRAFWREFGISPKAYREEQVASD